VAPPGAPAPEKKRPGVAGAFRGGGTADYSMAA
jgi:hypothetical protein